MAGLFDDDSYSTADVVARAAGNALPERARRRIMQKQVAGLELTPDEERMIENDQAARGAKADPIAEGGLGLMAEGTGVPSMIRGGRNMDRGYNEGSPLRMAGGAGEILLGATPGASLLGPMRGMVGKALSDPVRGAIWGGATTLPGAVANVADARAATPEGEMAAKIAKMPPDQLKAFQKMIGATADGRPGGETVMRALAYEKQQEDALKASAAQELAKQGVEGDNAAKIAAAKIKAEAEVAAAGKDKARTESANLPIRQLWPEASAMVPVASAVLAGATGGKIRGAAVNKYNRGIEEMMPRWKAAVDAKDPILAQEFQKTIAGMRAKGPGGFWPAFGAGGIEGAVIGTLPEDIDIGRGVPGAVERATSQENMIRGLTAGVIGAGTASLAALGVRAKGMKKESTGDYGPETAALTGTNQKGVSQAQDYFGYQAGLAKNKGLLDDQLTANAIKGEQNRGLLSGSQAASEEQALLLAEAQRTAAAARASAAETRQLGAGGPPMADAASGPSGATSVPPVTVQPPPRLPPQPAPVANQPQKALPPPEKDAREWANVWSEPARESVADFIKSSPGVPLSSLTAVELREMIISRLPPGAPHPSASTVRNKLADMKKAAGPGEMNERKFTTLMDMDPSRSRFGMVGPAIAAGGLAGGLGLMNFPNER